MDLEIIKATQAVIAGQIAVHFGTSPQHLNIDRDLEEIGNKMKAMAFDYIDNIYNKKKKSLKKFKTEWDYMDFCVFNMEPFGHLPPDFSKVFNRFEKELSKCGIVMLSPSRKHMLLILGGGWGFPKGKISPQAKEQPFECAIRETKEEVSFDCTPYTREEDVLNIVQNNVTHYFFIAFNITQSTKFKAKYMGEVQGIEWELVDEPTKQLTKLTTDVLVKLRAYLKKIKNKDRKVNYSLLARNRIAITTPPILEELDDVVNVDDYLKMLETTIEEATNHESLQSI
eukprot:m.29201 g.29201  ORF g.29201 m.29201 type:complete len:284 (-) comp6127_c0_seq3:1923-2774(-)